MPVTERPRIVVVHSSDELYGADRMLLQVLAALRDELGCEIDVWLPDDIEHGPFPLCERLTAEGYRWRHARVPVLRQAYGSVGGGFRLASAAIRVWRSLRTSRPDAVYLSSSACLLVAPVAFAARVPIRILHIQERWSGQAGRVLRFLGRWSTLRIAISAYVAETAGLPGAVVVVNCVDDASTRVDRELRRPGHLRRFVVASRWNRWKGHRTLLEAWNAAGCPGRLTVLGGPPPVGDGVEVDALVAELVARPETVEIVGEVSDPASFIAAADVLLLPSDEPEPFGLVVIEAFSLGKAVIASRAGGPLEVIDHDNNGWFFEPGDSHSLAALLARLDLDEIERCGVNARRAYERAYRPAAWRTRFAEIVGEHLYRQTDRPRPSNGRSAPVRGVHTCGVEQRSRLRWHRFILGVTGHFRRRRSRLLRELFPQIESYAVCDVGGSKHYWQSVADVVEPRRVEVFNIERSAMDAAGVRDEPSPGRFHFEVYDGKRIEREDLAFDLVLSNSVIEHVRPDERAQLASEMLRVAPRLFVQTPAKAFLIDPHFLMPIVHWVPRRVGRLLAVVSPWRWFSGSSTVAARRYFDSTQLLDKAEFQRLYPQADILVERWMGLPKSYIAVVRSRSRV